MPKTIDLCSDGRGCKYLPTSSPACVKISRDLECDILRERHNTPIRDRVFVANIIGCSTYEEKPVDKIDEFITWHVNTFTYTRLDVVEKIRIKLREIFGGKE